VGITAKILGAKEEHGAEVAANGSLRTASAPRPPDEWTAKEVGQEKVLVVPLLDSAGSGSLNVDGSVTPKDFYVGSAAGSIRWITEVRLILHDEQLSLDSNNEIRRFGTAAASPGLTNGVRLITRQNGTDVDLFPASEGGSTPGVKNLTQFYRYASEVFGLTAGVSASIDFLLVTVTLPKPVGLFPGSKDRVIVQVQDSLTTLNLFEAVAWGWYEVLDA